MCFKVLDYLKLKRTSKLQTFYIHCYPEIILKKVWTLHHFLLLYLSLVSVLDLQLTSLLSEIGLNIEEAHVFSTNDGFSLDAFVVVGWPYEVYFLIFSP